MDINKRIDFLIKKAKFNLSEEEKTVFRKDLIAFQESLKIFDEFELDDVEIARSPFEIFNSELREDEEFDNEISKDFLLKNASSHKDGFIFLKKDIK